MVYSLGGICSKKAAEYSVLSLPFIVWYGGLVIILGIYAIGWQQVIKRMPLTTAFANKAVTIVWGIIWGFVFFKEVITIGKVLGAMLVIVGVLLYSTDKEVSNG